MNADVVGRDQWVVRCQEIASLEQRDAFASPYVMVLSRTSRVPLRIEGTGLAIWDMVESPCLEADLVRDLARDFGMEPEEIAGDVSAFLSSLEDEGIVERTDRIEAPDESQHAQGLLG